MPIIVAVVTMDNPAYHVETSRLVIRCWSPSDAVLLHRSILESIEHLRPWMRWIALEPEGLEARIQRLRRYRAKFDSDTEYTYGVFDPAGRSVIGGCGLHPRCGPNAYEIGYWINVHHVRNGYATEVAGALTRIAFEINKVDRVEIRCDPANVASAAVPRKLGFHHDATLRARTPGCDGNLRDAMVWSMLEPEYASSPAASHVVAAFDAAGTKVLPRP